LFFPPFLFFGKGFCFFSGVSCPTVFASQSFYSWKCLSVSQESCYFVLLCLAPPFFLLMILIYLRTPIASLHLLQVRFL
jgi:hypothetical protein